MGSTGNSGDGTERPRRDRLRWRVGAPVAVVAPAYALVVIDPLASLGYLALVLVPIGVRGGTVGRHGRLNHAKPRSFEDEGDLPHEESADAGLVGDVGWRVVLLGLAGFVLIAVLFV